MKRRVHWLHEYESSSLMRLLYLHHLRKKLGGDFIETMRGVGYKLAPA